MPTLHTSKGTHLHYDEGFVPASFSFDYEWNLIQSFSKLEQRAGLLFNDRSKALEIVLWTLSLKGQSKRNPLYRKATPRIFRFLGFPVEKLKSWNQSVRDVQNTPPSHQKPAEKLHVDLSSPTEVLIKGFGREYSIEKTRWRSNPEKLFILMARYELFGLLSGISASVIPTIYDRIHKKFDAEVELFGSFFNTRLPYYFGLFPDLEKEYGCLGNFFQANLQKGTYVANPPFHLGIMNMFFKKIYTMLSEHANTTIYITIPAWRIKDRHILNQRCRNGLLKTDYEDDLDIQVMQSLITDEFLFCKNEYYYWDYLKRKRVHYAPTHVLIVTSIQRHKPDFSNIHPFPYAHRRQSRH